MKALLKKIRQVEIVKVFSLNAFSTFIHMCTGLINKIISGYQVEVIFSKYMIAMVYIF